MKKRLVLAVISLLILYKLYEINITLKNQILQLHIENYEIEESLHDIDKNIDLKALELRKNLLNKMFFTDIEIKEENFTSKIKELLLKNNLKVDQYQEKTNSVRFSIQGSIKGIIDFFYIIYKEKRIYKINFLNIQMTDNSNFKGNIEISRVFKNEVELENIENKTLLDLKKEIVLNSTIYTIFGKDLSTVINNQKDEITPSVIDIEETDKFIFIGTLKTEKNIITLFRDRYNSRIFKFIKGEETFNWLYLGENNNLYKFKNNNKIYEVKK